MTKTTIQLPILDFTKLHNPDTQSEFYQQLRYIAKEVGFFYLVGHGIKRQDRLDLLQAMKKFFALPKAEKEKISMSQSRHFRGYTAVTEESTRNKPDYREQIDIGEELPALSLRPEDPIWLNLQGPNQWPDAVPELKELALRWQSQSRAIIEQLLRAFLVALDVPTTSLDPILTGAPQHLLKLIHYPARNDQPDSEQGVGAHKDTGLLTFLWQDDNGGLQVETDSGWIDITPIEDAFVINIGEVLELATNGYLRANVHQVLRPKNGLSRYSIAYFITPNVEAKEVPLLPLPLELQQQALGPASDPLNPLFHNLGKNAMKGRLRSHLAVTQRFYPEQYQQIVENNNIS